MRKLVTHRRFGVFVLVMIILNTVVLAMDHHPIDAALADALEAANFGFTIFFALEMCLKLMALGFRDYARCVCLAFVYKR